MADQEVLQLAIDRLMIAVTQLIYDDPHGWSNRPCPTCKAVSGITGKPFGCYLYQQKRDQ